MAIATIINSEAKPANNTPPTSKGNLTAQCIGRRFLGGAVWGETGGVGGGVSGMTGVYRRQPGIKAGMHQGLKYRIPIRGERPGSEALACFWGAGRTYDLHFGNVHRLKKVEISLLDNDLTDSIEVISQDKLDFCHAK
ncbi:hypothetical protein [Rhodoferax sp. BLA1]|uniref:hypothetical protein n=1 Tax=Rhodoferax sp. BLA1 TaxID=2576062 RepID=UPI002106AB3D|nr:hypothetical protein [Rhodoferax sp. BLA1]